MIKRVSLIAILSLACALVGMSQSAWAVVSADWQAGKIIDDSIFFNKAGMSSQEIQSFIESKMMSCDTWGSAPYAGTTRAAYAISRGVSTPFVCLKDYRENPTNKQNNLSTSGEIAGGWNAGQIIKHAADTYNINPKVLIVLLEKEQALIGDDWPWPIQYRGATGYGCPDTAPCDAEYYGFYNQVMNAAKAFTRYASYPTDYRYQAGRSNFIQYNPNSSCSGSNVFIHNQATAGLYIYTPYQPNAAALNNLYGSGDSCSAYGNRNFWRTFSDWFGPLTGPAAFTVPGSGKIYIPVSKYKLSVPYAAAMNDYGISWEAVAKVSQDYADSIPNPPAATGISPSISHVIKSPSDSDADGGSLYLISLNNRYQFQSMDQFYAFGFKESDISYLPLEYIMAKHNAGLLPYYVNSPYGSVFNIDTQKKTKRYIFEYSSYISRNPSDRMAGLSYYLIDKIPSDKPIVDRPVMIKKPNSHSVVLYGKDESYNSIPTYDEFKCWSFEKALKTPVYQLPQVDYIGDIGSPEPIKCSFSIDGSIFMLNDGIRVPVPPPITPSIGQLQPHLKDLALSLPVRSNPLGKYVKTQNSAAVWRLEGEHKSVIPTYDTLALLKISDKSIEQISSDMLNSFTNKGIFLADGQLVKDDQTSTVYVVGDKNRYAIPTGEMFVSYNNPWGRIATLSQSDLDSSYTVLKSISPLLIDKSAQKAYLIAQNGCFSITDPIASLGSSIDTLGLQQPYSADIFLYKNLSNCKVGTSFIRASNSNLVYSLSSGMKSPITTYAEMLRLNGGSEPVVMTVDPSYLLSIPTR